MPSTHSIESTLREIGAGEMCSTAYDTAWIARLAKLGEPMGDQALDWLREHQLPDGTWGAKSPTLYHDRLVCTLAATIALSMHGNGSDKTRLERARTALETVIPAISTDVMIETVGFEVIVPTLFDEAEALGIPLRHIYTDLGSVNRKRVTKLASLPGGMINRFVTLAHSAEMAGTDGLRLLDIERLQEVNGSVGYSPAATAYFALQVRPEDSAALAYLRSLPHADGGIPDVYPIDVFEVGWTLWNLSLLESLSDEVLSLCQPHLDFLETAWNSKLGVGFGAGYTPKDGDDSSVVYEVLKHFGREVQVEPLLGYELDDYFRCFALESNPSISTNIHILGALRRAGYALDHPSVQKIVSFLQSTQYWFDKWHISPYYPTSHAIIACAGYADELIADAVSWMLSTQNSDGSWGYYMPTAEETAYTLQALTVWGRSGHSVPVEVLQRGSDWLMEYADAPYPPLWIGKCLYTPPLVVRSTILSALALVAEELGETVC
jgi:halimadienyl-diphosphate synthase